MRVDREIVMLGIYEYELKNRKGMTKTKDTSVMDNMDGVRDAMTNGKQLRRLNLLPHPPS